MPPFFTPEVRSRLSSVHKVTAVVAILQFLSGLLMLCVALSLLMDIQNVAKYINDDSNEIVPTHAPGYRPTPTPTPIPTSSDSVSEYANTLWALMIMERSFALAFCIPVMLVNVVGIIGYGFLSKGAAITHTVFNSLMVPFGMVMVILPVFEDAGVNIICYDSHYEGCDSIVTKFSILTTLFSVNIIASFVASILGCVGSGKVGSVNPAVGYQQVYSPYGTPAPSPFGTPAPSPFGNPPVSPFGNPHPSPFGNPPPSPFGNPPPSPFGNPPPSPFGNPPPSPFGNPPHSPFGNPVSPYGNHPYPTHTGAPPQAYP